MFEIENEVNFSVNDNTGYFGDISSDSSLNYTNSQDKLSLQSEFNSKYIEQSAIALDNRRTDLDLLLNVDPGNSLNDAKDIILTEASTTYKDWVGVTDTNDYYRFSIAENKNFSLTLTGLDDDADVQLLDSTGELVAESGKFGTTSENLQAQLLAGDYYIRVHPAYSNDNTSYSLTVNAATIPVVPWL